MSCIEAETVVAIEAVAGAGEASPAVPETETRDAIGAEQEAVGPCRKTRCGRRKRRHGNCIFGALRSNAGPDRPRRRTADRPAKLNQTPAPGRLTRRPGAVDSFLFPTTTDALTRHPGPRRFVAAAL